MTYGSGNTPDYRLAEKMKKRFSGRGSEVSGMQASTTSELVKRAQMGGDPSVNCSELDFRSGANRSARQQRPVYANQPARTYPNPNAARPQTNRTGNAQTPRTGTGNARPQTEPVRAAGTARTSAGGRTGNGGAAETRTAEKNTTEPKKPMNRSTAARTSAAEPVKPAKPKNVRTKNGTNTKNGGAKAAVRKKPKNKTAAAVAEFFMKLRPDPADTNGEIVEVRVEGRRMTPLFAVFLVIGTMMIMSLVLSFSEIYQTTSEISRLESDLAALRDTAAELELKLEEKNDIRVIEQIATGELGMVKEDAVQREYISLSDGEHIDIIEEETDGSETAAVGVLLSSIWSSLGSLFDYFR